MIFFIFLFLFNSINSKCSNSTKYSNNLINIEYTFKYDKFYNYGYLTDKLELNAILAIIHINRPASGIQLSNETNNLFNLVKLLNNIYLIKLNRNNIANNSSSNIISSYLNVIINDEITLLNSVNLEFKVIKQNQLKIYFQNLNTYNLSLNKTSLTINENFIYITKIQPLINSNLLPFDDYDDQGNYVIDRYNLVKLNLAGNIFGDDKITFSLNNNGYLYAKFNNNNNNNYDKQCYNLTINAYDEQKILYNATLDLEVCFNSTKLNETKLAENIYLNENTCENFTHLLVYNSKLENTNYKYSMVDFKTSNITDIKYFTLNSTNGSLWLNKELIMENSNCFYRVTLLAQNKMTFRGDLIINLKIFCNFSMPSSVTIPAMSSLFYNYVPIFVQPFVNNSIINFQIDYDSDLMRDYEFLLTEIDYLSIVSVIVKFEMIEFKKTDLEFVSFNMNSSKFINLNFNKSCLMQYESANSKINVKLFKIRISLWNEEEIEVSNINIQIKIRVLFIKNLLQLNQLNIIRSNENEIDFQQSNNSSELNNYLAENFQFKKCTLNFIQLDNLNYNYFINLNVPSDKIILFNINNSYYKNERISNEMKLNCSLISYSKNLNLALNMRIVANGMPMLSFNSNSQIKYLNIINPDSFEVNLKQQGENHLYFISNDNYDFVFDYFKIDHINGVFQLIKPFDYEIYSKSIVNNQSIVFINILVYSISSNTIQSTTYFSQRVGLVFQDFIIKYDLEICAEKYNHNYNIKNMETSSKLYELDNFKCNNNSYFRLDSIKQVYNFIKTTSNNIATKFNFINQTFFYKTSVIDSNLIEIYQAKFIIISAKNSNISAEFEVFYKIQNTFTINFKTNETSLRFNSNQIEIFSKLLNVYDYLTVESNGFNHFFNFQLSSDNFYLNKIDGNLYNLIVLSEKYFYDLKIILNNKYSLNVNIKLNGLKQTNSSYKIENVDQLLYINSNRYINIIQLNKTFLQPICLNIEQITCNNLFQTNRNFLQIDKRFYTDKISTLNLMLDNDRLFITVEFLNVNIQEPGISLFNQSISKYLKSPNENQFKLIFKKNSNLIKTSIYLSTIRNFQTNSEVLGLSYDFIKLDEDNNQCIYNLIITDIFLLESNQIYAFDFKQNSTDDLIFDTFYILRVNESLKQIYIEEFLQYYENDIQNGQVVFDLDQIYYKSLASNIIEYESNAENFFLIDRIVNDNDINIKEFFTIGETPSDSSLVYLNNRKTLNLDRELLGSTLKFIIKKFYVVKNTLKINQVITFEVFIEILDINDNQPTSDFYYKKLDVNLANYLIDSKNRYSSILIDNLNGKDKDSLNKCLIYEIDYNNTNIPFKIDKYFGNLEYMMTTSGISEPKLYKFNVIINDYQFKCSVLFEVLIFKTEPIVKLDGLDVNYEIAKSTINNNSTIIAKLNLNQLDYSNDLTYEVIYYEKERKFSVDYSTGIIRAASNITELDDYSMKILVRNSTKSSRIVYLIVNVFIKFIDDNIKINEKIFYFDSSQQNETYSLIANSSKMNSFIVYQEYKNLFSIDKYTNRLWCSECRDYTRNTFSLIVLVSTFFNQSEIFYIQFKRNQTVAKSNNSTETFNSTLPAVINGEVKNIELNLNENIQIGTLILDLNSMRNYSNLTQTIYKLFNNTNDSIFYFHFQNGQLILKYKFEYELKSEINLQILCLNLVGRKMLTLNVTTVYNIKIKIVKYNNQKPQFAYISYNFELNIKDLMVNQTEKYSIDNVRAYNKYSQSSISYYLQSFDEISDDYSSNDYDLVQGSSRSVSLQNNNNDESYFDIEPFSGLLTINSIMIMNNLKKTYYKFYIVAQDSSTPSLLSSIVLCEINLFSSINEEIYRNLNNFQININLNAQLTMFSLNSLLFTPNDIINIVYGLPNGFKQLPFQVDITNGNFYLINTAVNIVKSYEFNVSLNNLTPITLNININNKNMLQFEKDYYDVYLDLNTILGQTTNSFNNIILPANFIRAYYPTVVSSKSNIKYYLLQRTINSAKNIVDLNSFLNFNSKNAEISLINSINSNSFHSFLNAFINGSKIYPLFKILAVDELNQNQNSTTILRINFIYTLDIKPATLNDKPKFKKLYSTHVLEKSSIGTLILHIELDWSSTTNDSIKSDVKFLFLNSNGKSSNFSSNNEFYIDSKSGFIYINTILDREAQDYYVLNIIAVTSQWYIQTDASIYIDDINDNEPIFSIINSSKIELNSNQLLDSLRLSKSRSINILKFKATDADIGLNGQIYYLLDSSVNGLFSLDPVNGFLSLNFNVDTDRLETSLSYELKIQAFDKGLPQQSSQMLNFSICISNSDDQDRNIELGIPYSISNNTILYQYNNLENGQLMLFSLNKSANLLTYNATNRYLNINTRMMNSNLINSSFFFILKINSESDYIFSRIKITITDTNFFKPELVINKNQINIKQSTVIGSEIYNFFGIDQDYGLNGLIKYKLNDQVEVWNENSEKITISIQQSPFMLDSSTGSLLVNKNLNGNNIYYKYNLTVYAIDSALFYKKSDSISLVVLIYDKYFNYLLKDIQQPLYFSFNNQQESNINISKINEKFPELSVASVSLLNQKCSTFDLEMSCYSIVQKEIIINDNNSDICHFCNFFSLKINVIFHYLDMIKEAQITVYINYKKYKIKKKFSIFSNKTLILNNGFNLTDIISNGEKTMLSLLKFKLISNEDLNSTIFYNSVESLLDYKIFSTLKNKNYRLYLQTYLNDVQQDECLINLNQNNSSSFFFIQPFSIFTFDSQSSFLSISSILSSDQVSNFTLNVLNSNKTLFHFNECTKSIELSSISRPLNYLSYTYILNATSCSSSNCDSTLLVVNLALNDYKIHLPSSLIILGDKLFYKSIFKLPIYKINEFISSYQVISENNDYGVDLDYDTGVISINSSKLNKINSMTSFSLTFDNSSEFKIDIILIDIDKFVNLNEFLMNRTIDFYYTNKQINNLNSSYKFTNLLPQEATNEFEKLLSLDKNLNKFMPIYNIKCSSLTNSDRLYKITSQCEFFMNYQNSLLNNKDFNLKIRLSNDGYSKSLFYDLKINFIKIVQILPDYRILNVEILNVDNIGVNMFNFNKYLQNSFNSTINHYDKFNRNMLIQVNNIGTINRKLLQIKDDFKIKINLNRDYIKQLFQIDILKVISLNSIDSCSSDSCSKNNSNTLCVNQLVDNNGIFNYKQSINFKNYQVVSIEENIYEICNSSCESYFDKNFNAIDFKKLNHIIYKNLLVEEKLFLKFLFKVDLTTTQDQFVFHLNLINQDYFINCELINQKVQIKFNFDNNIQNVNLKEQLQSGLWYQLQISIQDQLISIELKIWDILRNNGFLSCSDLSFCRAIYNIYNKKVLLNKKIDLYIGGLDTYEISNSLVNENKILKSFYSNNLKLAKFQLNYYNDLFDFDNNFEKYIFISDKKQTRNNSCNNSNESVYCGGNIWSSNCSFALGELKLNSSTATNNSFDPFLTILMMKNYARFISIIKDFDMKINYNFNLYIEFQLNSIYSSLLFLRSQNTMLILNYNKSSLDLYYNNQILISESFNFNKISNNLSLTYNHPENLIEMRLNNNSGIHIASCFMDLFLTTKIEVINQQNADILLSLLVINDKQIPLYNGNNGEYKTIINKNVLLINDINWITTTRKAITTPKLTTTVLNTVSSSQNSFLNPWGIVIIVGVGLILIISSIIFISIFSYKRKKRRNEEMLASNKNHSTFNSRNGLLFAKSNLSTSSASSIFSSSTSNEKVNKFETPTNQSNQSLLQSKRSLKKRNSESFMNTNIKANIGTACNSDKSYCDCSNKTSTITNNNSERVKSSRNKSVSSTNSSLIFNANDDQFNTTTTESLKTFGSNELNILTGPSDSNSTSSTTNNNNILPNELNEQFKQILNWTPSYDFFKDVLEDLSSLESDENNDKNYYHETEQQHDIFYNNLKIIKNLNQVDINDYNHLYEKEICIQNNFIELPVDLNMLNHTLNSLSDNTQSFV